MQLEPAPIERREALVTMQIRKAQAADVPAIVSRQLAMAWETEQLELNAETVQRGVSQLVSNPAVGFYYVVEVGRQIRAVCMILKEWSDWRAGEVLWLHSLYVDPDWRQHGITKAIVNRLKDEVHAASDKFGVRLYVEKDNKIAKSVYSRLGMKSDHYLLYEWMKT